MYACGAVDCQLGTEVWVARRLATFVKGCDLHNARIASVNVKTSTVDVQVVAAYAPHSGHSLAERNAFFAQLDALDALHVAQELDSNDS